MASESTGIQVYNRLNEFFEPIETIKETQLGSHQFLRQNLTTGENTLYDNNLKTQVKLDSSESQALIRSKRLRSPTP